MKSFFANIKFIAVKYMIKNDILPELYPMEPEFFPGATLLG